MLPLARDTDTGQRDRPTFSLRSLLSWIRKSSTTFKVLAILTLASTTFLRIYWKIFTHVSVTLCLFLSFVYLALPLWTASEAFGLLAKFRDTQATTEFLPGRKTWRWILAFAFVLYSISWGGFQWNPSIPDLPTREHLIPSGERFFIAANFRNNQDVLPYFVRNLLGLVDYLGAENVFISIVESNSVDATRTILQKLDASLSARSIAHEIRSVDLDRTWADSWGRVEFMAMVRNMAMEPMRKERVLNGNRFSKVMWFNDVYFEWRDALRMLLTDSMEYDQICATDFAWAGLYDLWVIRDRCGRTVSSMWPFVYDEPSRRALKEGRPIEVMSCWNGMTFFNAEPFMNVSVSVVDDDGSPAPSPAVQFRSMIPSTDCLASECFLVSYDLRQYIHSSYSRAPIVLMDPRTVVAYEWRWYVLYKWIWEAPLVRVWMWVWERWFWWDWIRDKVRWDDGDGKGEERGCSWDWKGLPLDCQVGR